MTIEEMDAEIARMHTMVTKGYANEIARLTRDLEGAITPSHREFVEWQLARARATLARIEQKHAEMIERYSKGVPFTA